MRLKLEVTAQFAGGIAAAFAVYLLFGAIGGATIPLDGTAYARNVGTEAMISFLLMLVIMAVATDRRVPSNTAQVAIGGDLSESRLNV